MTNTSPYHLIYLSMLSIPAAPLSVAISEHTPMSVEGIITTGIKLWAKRRQIFFPIFLNIIKAQPAVRVYNGHQ